MLRPRLSLWLGMGGCPPGDNSRALLWERRLHWLMVGVALLALPAFLLNLHQGGGGAHIAGQVLDFLIFGAFAAELVWMMRVSSQPGHYLARNWMDLLVVLASLASLFGNPAQWVAWARLFRVALVGVLLLKALGALRHLFTPRGAPFIVGFAAFCLLLAGAGFYWLEPTVHSFGDGVWLAFVTGTTVGYGDLIPTTWPSRIFAALMAVLGFSLLSIMTATIVAVFMEREERQLRQEMHRDIKDLKREIQRLREEIRGDRPRRRASDKVAD